MSESKINGFIRGKSSTDDWLIFEDGTKISTGDGERILRFIRTIDNNRRSGNLSEAIGYIKSRAKVAVTKRLYAIAARLNRGNY